MFVIIKTKIRETRRKIRVKTVFRIKKIKKKKKDVADDECMGRRLARTHARTHGCD